MIENDEYIPALERNITAYMITIAEYEAKEENIKVVATGGLGRIISQETDFIDIYDANLTLEGIYRIYKKQNRK